MQIVIGGDGDMALLLAEELSAEHEVMLIVPEGLRIGDSLDVSAVHGSLSSPVTLRKAGCETADVFIACTHHNETNIVACVVAKDLGAGRRMCFFFDHDFKASAREDEALAEQLGIELLVRPSHQLAEEIVRIVSVPGALDVEIFAGGRVRLLRYEVEQGASLTSGPLSAMQMPEGVVLVMGRRGDEAFIPRGDTCFEAGDKVTAMGTPMAISRLPELLRGEGHHALTKRATVVGGGMVGLAVAQGLEQASWEVKVIEADSRRGEQIEPLLRTSKVHHGDGADLELLESEAVGEDAVLIAVTSNDEKNLLVSLMAKDMGVPRIVTRADIPANERLFEKVGIDVVRSANGAAINKVARGLLSGRRGLLAELEHGDAEILELTLPDDVAPRPVHGLIQPVFAVIGAIFRGAELIIPRGSDEIRGGDRLLLFCASEDEEQLREFFQKLSTVDPAAAE